MRATRVREHAASIYRWNAALHAVTTQMAEQRAATGGEPAAQLVRASQELFAKDGLLDELKKAGEKMKEDPEAAAKMMAKHGEKLGELMAKMTALSKENPELMANEKVQNAMKMFR